MTLPNIGELFEGRYELRSELGHGGFAVVYRAFDRSMQRDVAIKIQLPQRTNEGSSGTARFFREARVLSELQHPNIVTLYEFGESSGGNLFMVSEFVDGRDLVTVLRQDGPLRPADAIRVLDQLLDALHAAHARDLLHRDVKPANILIHRYFEDAYRAKLIDFGVAKPLQARGDAQLTAAGAVVGTLRYMSPEQLGADPVDARTDLYALGLVGYEMLTAEPAIQGSSQRTLITEQMSRHALTVPAQAGPAPLRDVLDKAMARDANDRWPSAAAMRDALRQAQREIERPRAAQQPPTLIEPRPQPASPTAQPTQRRWRVPLGALAAASLGLILAASLLARDRVEDEDVHQTTRRAAPYVAPSPEPTPDAERASAQATLEPDAGADSGTRCRDGVPEDYDGTLELDWPGGRVPTYLPLGYNGSERLPIVMLMHRPFRDGRFMLEVSGLRDLADEHRFVILAPTSTNPVKWATDKDRVIRRMLDAAAEQLCIDPTRRYLVGDEDTGKNARKLTCRIPFSAYAVTMDGSDGSCVPLYGAPRMRIYGRRDLDLPIEGGEGCNPLRPKVSPAGDITRMWHRRLDCKRKSKRWKPQLEGGVCHEWDCENAGLVECVTDDGHHWPGSDGPLFKNELCDVARPAREFPFGEAIWTFFSERGVVLPEDHEFERRVESGDLSE